MTSPPTDELVQALLIEDDDRLAALTERYLSARGVVVVRKADGRRGLAEAFSHRYDIVILDVVLPDLDGVELCRRLRRQSDVPIIMISARGAPDERVLGLDTGADDYVAKPFEPRELLARVHTQVRRSRGLNGPSLEVRRCGGLELDPRHMSASLDGVALELTSVEFRLLKALADHAGRPISRERLLDLAHGPGGGEAAFERSVDVHVSRLRRKLGEDPRRPGMLLTVRGQGYMMAGSRP